jgi:peptide/nickel transport system permease protein
MTGSDSVASFERIDWDTEGTSQLRLSSRTKGFLLSLALVAAVFFRDYFLVPDQRFNIGRWRFALLDWLFVLSLLVVVFFVVVPLARDRERTAGYWRQLRGSRLATASFLYIVAFVVVGALGPAYTGRITFNLPHQFQPPLFVSVENHVVRECVGEAVGGYGGRCHGSLTYPLGTNRDGKALVDLSLSGMHVALQVALITSMIIVPIATAVGTVAGYVGGWVDELLMRYVDIQQAIPAFIVYLMVIFVYGRSLFVFIAVFGLFNWGGVARLVRADVLQLRESEYVLAAENAGASSLFIIRRHILPNVSGTVVTATTRQIPMLILAEAAISYLNLNDIVLMSWGEAIALGLHTRFPEVWWDAVIPVMFLSTTVLAFSLFGDALRDLLDPRVTP